MAEESNAKIKKPPRGWLGGKYRLLMLVFLPDYYSGVVVLFGGIPAARRFSRWIASYTSWRWTGTSPGASIPRRTLSPRMSTIVITILSPIIMLSSRCLLKTSMISLLRLVWVKVSRS